jgi:cellulose synthase/poly-beta-1,6-N-acetylglucosamine synthase-like glycosyltransferase
LNAIHVTPGPFSIFRREVFAKIGYFRHAHNTEDMEMALRLHSNNYKIENSHNAWVYTVGPRSLKALYKQRVRWTHGFLENALDYRHLFFNRKYGNIGFLTLPFSAVSIFGFTLMMGITLSNLVFTMKEKYAKFSTIGFDPQFNGWSFSWFYINTQALALVSLFAFLLTLTFMFMAKRLVGENSIVSRDMIYYIILYPFIAPLWLMKSVYNTAFSRKSSWR